MDNLDRLQQFTNMKSGDLGVLAPILTSIYSNFAVRLQHNLSRDMLYPHKSSIHIPLCSIPLICLKYISLKHLLSRAIPIFFIFQSPGQIIEIDRHECFRETMRRRSSAISSACHTVTMEKTHGYFGDRKWWNMMEQYGSNHGE
jgi:hypothetical protein